MKILCFASRPPPLLESVAMYIYYAIWVEWDNFESRNLEQNNVVVSSRRVYEEKEWRFLDKKPKAIGINYFCRFSPYEWEQPHSCIKDLEGTLINQFSLLNSLWFTIGKHKQSIKVKGKVNNNVKWSVSGIRGEFEEKYISEASFLRIFLFLFSCPALFVLAQNC